MGINPYSIVPFTSSLLAFSLGWVTYLRNSSSRLHQRFFLLCMSVFVWPFSLSIMLNLSQSSDIIFWTKIGHTTCTFAPAVFVDFVLILLRKEHLRWLSRIYYVCAAFFISAMWLSDSYFGGQIFTYSWGKYAAAGPLVTVDAITATTAVLFCWPFLIQAVRRAKTASSALEYNKLRYFPVALFLFCFALLDYLPKYGIGIPPIGSFFIAAFAMVVTYAIVRHQLLDITVAVRRTVVYSTLAALITGVYFSLVLVTEKTLQDVIGYRSVIGSLMAGFA